MITKIIVRPGDSLGCGQYRMAIPYKALSKFGFDVELGNRLDNTVNPEDSLLVLQRQHADDVYMLTEDFVKRGGKMVFETDDYFRNLPPNNPAAKHYPPGGKEVTNMEKFMSLSSLMTVSTPALKDAYSDVASNIHVCYNHLDMDMYNEPPKIERNDGIVRILWGGSATHHDDLMTVIQPLTEIMRENHNVHFYFVGMNYSNLFPKDVQPRMFFAGHTFPVKNGQALFYTEDGTNPVTDYYQLLKRVDADIAIAPLCNHTFNRKKSYLKLMEYGLIKVPFVATNFGPYFEYAVNKSSLSNPEQAVGFLAEKNTHWRKYLKALIDSKELRNQIATNNYNYVINEHTIDTGVTQWLNALQTIGIKPIAGRIGSFVENFH